MNKKTILLCQQLNVSVALLSMQGQKTLLICVPKMNLIAQTLFFVFIFCKNEILDSVSVLKKMMCITIINHYSFLIFKSF